MFERGKYGIEYKPRPKPEGSGGLGWVFLVVTAVAAVSLSLTLWNRYLAGTQDGSRPVEPPAAEARIDTAKEAVRPAPAAVETVDSPRMAATDDGFDRRPAKVRNLLMRLDEAERRQDLEMAVSTIEQLRALPGSPAADLDDSLARRLGDLNMRWLLAMKNAQWVVPVTVKRGDSASRIAAEHGSTLSSVVKLNGKDVEKIIVGQTLYVMNHPRFQLIVRRRTRTADLTLNGKFFKRYDLVDSQSDKTGAFELTVPARQFWKDMGVVFGQQNRAEIEMLMPAGSPVLVSEM